MPSSLKPTLGGGGGAQGGNFGKTERRHCESDRQEASQTLRRASALNGSSFVFPRPKKKTHSRRGEFEMGGRDRPSPDQRKHRGPAGAAERRCRAETKEVTEETRGERLQLL